MHREFLGWGEMPIECAVAWLVRHFGSDMDGVLVALPGARSGRILVERLARSLGPQLRPPDIVTAGLASDALLTVEGTPASRLVRTLAWQQALAGLARDDARMLSRVVARAPAPEDLAGWMSLAEEVRGLFGEVAAESLEFADVACNEVVASIEGEQRRWQALAAAQARMEELVEQAGFIDPHLGRLRAIRARRTRPVRAVVLIGVSEMNELLRQALDSCEAPVSALVFAPEELSQAFDLHGALIPEAWAEWESSLDAASQWFVVGGPDEQAQRAARVIRSWAGSHAAEDISIGLADREVAPYLKAVLGEGGAVARDAAGTPMRRTRPAVLLDAVARFVEGRRYADFAKLVRHPDFEAALRVCDASLEPVALVDRYHAAHLPSRVDGRWLADSDDAHDRRLAAEMARLWRASRSVLGGLLAEGRGQGGQNEAGKKVAGQKQGAQKTQKQGVASESVRQLLQLVYGGRELDPAAEPDRVLIASLWRLGEVLTEIEGLPSALAPGGGAAAGIALVMRAIAGDEVPPAAAKAGDPTLEMLGWLELALDDAPALVVTGFEDGRVPESVLGDAYLPNRLRQSLGIVDNQKRLARDLYATELLLRSRERVAFITGRRSAAGDPQLPSRIVFHCSEPEVVERVKRFLDGTGQVAKQVPASLAVGHELPRLDHDVEVDSMSVTAFARYLQSPYQFYLERIAKLETLDDRARELDPMSFGSLAHCVLQRFGEDEEVRGECDETRIAQYLKDALSQLGAERYGRQPLPAVRLQLEQLAHRLGVFAGLQARRREAGWEIRATEWSPAQGYAELPVDGTPMRLTGRIDRIDYNAQTKQWAIWDYKTGEKVDPPLSVHRRSDGAWKDLQLPLYCLLAVELLGDAEPAEVGYIALPREEQKIRFDPVERWTRSKTDSETFAEGLESAFDAAHEVVRRIRRFEFFSHEGFAPRDPIFEAIGGVGIIAASARVEDPEHVEPEA